MTATADISAQLKGKFAIVLYLLFGLIYIGIVGQKEGDFLIYLSASKDLFHGKNIYSMVYFDGYRYYYSLLFAILIYPLSFLPFVAAIYIWLLINAIILWRLIKIIGCYFDLSALSVKKQWLFVILSCAFSANFALANIYHQQITIVILFLTLKGLEYIFSGKEIMGAVLIALGINFKLLPLLLLPYLLYRKKYIAFVFIVATYAAMLFLPALIIGMDENNLLLKSWWNLINPCNKEHVLDVTQHGFVSITSFLSALLVNVPIDQYELHLRRNIANLDLAALTYVINTVRLAFGVFTLYFLRTRPFFSKINQAHRIWEISYILLIIPLVFPHQQLYSFLFAMPAIWCIFYYLLVNSDKMKIRRFMWMKIILTFSFLTINASFLLGEFNPYYEHYKIVTYGVLALVPMLAMSIPDLKTEDTPLFSTRTL